MSANGGVTTLGGRFLRSGGYLWNAGIFVFTAAAILEETRVCAPELHSALAPLRRTPGVRRGPPVERAYRLAPSLALDVAVMERSRRVWTLPVSFRWSDVGTWESLACELGVAPGTSRVIEGDLVHDDLGGNLVWVQSVTGVTGAPRGKGEKQGRGRSVALLGVEGLAVIDTADVLLVARLDRASDVRGIVKGLNARGRAGIT